MRFTASLALALALVLVYACSSRGSSHSEPDDVLIHTVRVGETISDIARNYQVPLWVVIEANDISQRILPAGTRLRIPGGREPIVPAKAHGPLADGFYHTRTSWCSHDIDLANIDPMNVPPTKITLHHTGQQIDSTWSGTDLMERIEDQHRKRGWACIGYHFIIASDGTVWEGRPLGYQGAHAGGDNNIGNIGISIAGDYNLQQLPISVEAKLIRLLDQLRAHYGIPRSAIEGHDHYKITDCPGRNLHAFLHRYKAMGDA